MVLLAAEVTMAAPYSIDLRERVAKAWDESGDADEVAATFSVSRAWVHRLIQRRRETGSIVPRKQTMFRSRVLAGQEPRLPALSGLAVVASYPCVGTGLSRRSHTRCARDNRGPRRRSSAHPDTDAI